jgi:hypothetical protein
MANNQIQEKAFIWQSVFANWVFVKGEYARFTAPIGGYILPFLEGYLAETYGEAVKNVTDVLRRAKYNSNEIPFASYIVIQAEHIEPVFRERLKFMMETMIFTHLEHERTKKDYLGYLLTSNAEEPPEQYARALNKEIAFIGKIILGAYNARMKKEKLEFIIEYIMKTVNSSNFAAKQFIIVAAIYLEPEYRKRFLPSASGQPFRAKPERFIRFAKDVLPEKFRKLKTGVFSGLLEFMNDVRPAYWMIG